MLGVLHRGNEIMELERGSVMHSYLIVPLEKQCLIISKNLLGSLSQEYCDTVRWRLQLYKILI